MSVSEDLLCSFELLKPLDGAALKKEMTKSKRKSQVLNVFFFFFRSIIHLLTDMSFGYKMKITSTPVTAE